ncbi:MAG TPA: TlpA disulfide reductase family protein [Pyrinomonadaceae bacterium]|nr:TlpA disulfide reductase family protein [Pyrinomonadaceae bacterium]
MKRVVSNFLLLTAFVGCIVILQGCTNTANSQKGPVDEIPPSNEQPATGRPSAKGSDYPKIATSVSSAEIKALDGSVFTINDRQGKVLLLNLWATWCGPCRFEIPALVRLQESLRPKGFEVIGLNTDEETVQLIEEFSSELKVNYPMAYADTSLQSSLLKISKFPGIPQSFLIDRDGRLRGVFRGANPADIAKMEEVVAKVVNEDPSSETEIETGIKNPEIKRPVEPGATPPAEKGDSLNTEKRPTSKKD